MKSTKKPQYAKCDYGNGEGGEVVPRVMAIKSCLQSRAEQSCELSVSGQESAAPASSGAGLSG